MRSLAHLAGLAEKHRNDPLVIVATHVQTGSDDKILALVERLGLRFTVTRQGAYEGSNLGGGIPQMFVFDHTGKEIYQGRGGKDMDQKIAEALRRVPGIPLGEARFVRLGSLADRIHRKRSLGAAARRVRKLASDPDPAIRREAELLDGILDRYVDESLTKARRIGARSAIACLRRLDGLAREFAGDPREKKVRAAIAALEADAGFARSLRAENELRRVMDIVSDLEPCSTCRTAPMRENEIARCTLCRRFNRGELARLEAGIKSVLARYPDTPAVTQGKKVLIRYGLGTNGEETQRRRETQRRKSQRPQRRRDAEARKGETQKDKLDGRAGS